MMRMLAGTVGTQDDAGVLDGAVGIKQASADDPDLRVLEVPDHRREPARAQRSDVVVQQTDVGAFRQLHRCVVRCCEVEMVRLQEQGANPAVGAETRQDRLLAVIEWQGAGHDDDDFEGRVVGAGEYGTQATDHVWRAASGRHDQADQRLAAARRGDADVEGAGGLDASWEAGAGEVLADDRSQSGGRCGLGVWAAVSKDVGDAVGGGGVGGLVQAEPGVEAQRLGPGLGARGGVFE